MWGRMPSRPKLQTSDLHEAFHPRLKLFLSLDIVGSTAYKQPLDLSRIPVTEVIAWANTIQSFFRTVEQSVSENWRSLEAMADQVDFQVGSPPRLWKTAGDEVIYWKELEDDCDIWLAVAIWTKVIESVREDLSNSGTGLDVKPTLYVAGFPIRNRVVVTNLAEPGFLDRIKGFYDSRGAAGAVDFIGPGIDVGFRLSGLSSPKKMSISVDCAYLMAVSAPKICDFEAKLHAKFTGSEKTFFSHEVGKSMFRKSNQNGKLKVFDPSKSFFLYKFSIYFSGRKELKGVLGGTHYPHFWINAIPSDSLISAQDDFYRNYRNPVEWRKLEKFCEKFYADRARYIGAPFINRTESLTSKNLSSDYRKTHTEFVRLMTEEDDVRRTADPQNWLSDGADIPDAS